MDMVNDGKDIRLDTPQAVKEALASGKDLYNPETGELAQAMRAASAEMADGEGKHDIGLETR